MHMNRAACPCSDVFNGDLGRLDRIYNIGTTNSFGNFFSTQVR